MSAPQIHGEEHWIEKAGVRLFLWEKFATSPAGKPAILFVHGSSMASQPSFDLHVPGHPASSVMNWFASRGFDCWSVDCEGYGRSDKGRDISCDIATGAEDVLAAARYIRRARAGAPLLVYGSSSGALRAGLFAQRNPELVARLALDAFVWTGAGSPTLMERTKKLPQYLAANRRPIDRAFVESIYTRDQPGTADAASVQAFADAVLALDQSVPTGSYVDMCTKLPLVEPDRLTVPTLVMRGEHDGIATFEDVLAFFARLPNPDKRFALMPGIAHSSFRQKNYEIALHILHSFFTQPEPIYTGA